MIVAISKKATLIIIIGYTQMVAASAFAQGSDNEENPTNRIEVISVTAQKRSESIQDVPIAVSAFSQSQLLSRGALSGGDLQKYLPNVLFDGDTGFGAYNFQVRGIGAQIESVAADTGVGVHINNAPVTVNRFTHSEFYDVERVEVLRGPQGTLYGRNATGGVVNIITALPEEVFSAKLAVDYGRFDAKRVTGHVNVPLSDTLALRAAGFFFHRDGTHYNTETHNDVETKDIWSGRFSLAWKPTNSLSMNLMWEHFDQDDTTGGSRKLICATDPGPDSLGGQATNAITRLTLSNSCLNTRADDPRNNGYHLSGAAFSGIFSALGGLQSLDAMNGRIYSSDPYTISSPLDPLHIAENDLMSLSFEYHMSEQITLTSLTSYSTDSFRGRWAGAQAAGANTERFAITPFTPDGVVVDPILGNFDVLVNQVYVYQTADQLSQEIRLQSHFDGDINFNVGGIYIDLERLNSIQIVANGFTHFANVLNATAFAGGPQINFDQNVTFPTGMGRNYYNVRNDYTLNASALFGEAYYRINKDTKATLGLRYTQDKKALINAPIVFLTPVDNVQSGAEQQRTFRELTGRFTLDWQVWDDTLLYASASRGYKGGGFNPLTPDPSIPTSFEPELVTALEIGSKTAIGGGQGTVNLSAFYYDYGGYQIAQLINNSPVNENVDATIYGLEVETQYALNADLTLNANIGLLHTAIDDGVTSVDVYNRTQGDPNYTSVNSFSPLTPGGGCALPTNDVVGLLGAINNGVVPSDLLGLQCSGATLPDGTVILPSPNAISGVPVDLGGNNLPLSPSVTMAIGAEYYVDINPNWSLKLRADYAYRSGIYGRIFNTTFDEISELHNLNLSIEAMSVDGLEIQWYARNLLSHDAMVTNHALGETSGSLRAVRGKEPVTIGLRLTQHW